MLRAILLSLLFVVSTTLNAASAVIDAGGITLTVPIPTGFTKLTEQHGQTFAYHSRLVAPSNVFLAVLIEDKAALAAHANPGEALMTPKRIGIQMPRVAVGRNVDAADLAGIKRETLKLNDEQFEKLQERANANFGRALTLAREFSDLDVGLSLVKSIPLPIHDESPTHFSYSSFTRASLAEHSQGRAAEVAIVSTVTMMVVRSRLVLITMATDAEDLDSQRSVQRELVREIQRANP